MQKDSPILGDPPVVCRQVSVEMRNGGYRFANTYFSWIMSIGWTAQTQHRDRRLSGCDLDFVGVQSDITGVWVISYIPAITAL